MYCEFRTRQMVNNNNIFYFIYELSLQTGTSAAYFKLEIGGGACPHKCCPSPLRIRWNINRRFMSILRWVCMYFEFCLNNVFFPLSV